MMNLSNIGFNTSWLVFVLPAMMLAGFAQMRINSAFGKYSKVPSNTGYTGAQAARTILDKNGLKDVSIRQIPGKLTDHYNPQTRELSLSQSVYSGGSIASLSVAAHEVGHAIQHAEGYFPLILRNNIAPIANIGSRLVWVFIMIGFLISPFFIELGIVMFLSVVLFQVVTLPVEFNASKRALLQLEDGIMDSGNIKPAKKVLNAAALTYVAATLVAVAQLLRLLLLSNNRRD